jgi:hypothetical protein
MKVFFVFDKVSINDLLVSEIQEARLKPSLGLKRLVGLAKPKVTLTKKVCKKLLCKKRKPKKVLRRK